MPKGTAMSKARKDETSVPYMNGNAPNCSATGSHVEAVRKWNPNFLMASVHPCHSCHPVKIIRTTTVSAIASVSHSNAWSPSRDGAPILVCAEGSSIAMDAATAIQFYQLISSRKRPPCTPYLRFDVVDSL